MIAAVRQICELPPLAVLCEGARELQHPAVVLTHRRSVRDSDTGNSELAGNLKQAPLKDFPHSRSALIEDCEAWPMVQQPSNAKRLLLTQRQDKLPIHLATTGR